MEHPKKEKPSLTSYVITTLGSSLITIQDLAYHIRDESQGRYLLILFITTLSQAILWLILWLAVVVLLMLLPFWIVGLWVLTLYRGVPILCNGTFLRGSQKKPKDAN